MRHWRQRNESIFAKNREEATPKAQEFVEKVILPYFGRGLTCELHEAVPWYSDVSDYEGNRWVDITWGLSFLAEGNFSVYDHAYFIEEKVKEADLRVDHMEIIPQNQGLFELRLGLSGRLSHSWEEEEE